MTTLSFTLNLLFYLIPVLLRGPYLQSATSTSMVIRWRTDVATDSRVCFGTSPATLAQIVDSLTLTTEHEVKLTGLQPKTKYYYSIGSTQAVLQTGNDHFFETAPPPGQAGKYRIGVLGDCGNNSVNQLNVRDRLSEFLGAEYMDAWLLLGDNAYNSGTDAEFQSGFFNIYKDRFLKQSPVFPCPGNHDYANDATRQIDHNVPYYSLFTVPSGGEAGGLASGTPSYYSFDYGNIHFLSLDSYGMEDAATRLYDTLGTQVQWIKADLAANTNKEWVVAYWHHPPFTKGSHDSDTETELMKIRKNFIRILERNGVDLVLCGHSHDYERSKLMKGHYDAESTFDPLVYNVSQSTARYDGSPDSCPYVKKTPGNAGTVYVVAGSAGKLGGTKAGYPHDAMPIADAQHGGALLLQVEGNRLDGKWIASDGVVRDQFTIVKDAAVTKSVQIQEGDSVTINASYVGAYWWNTAETTRDIQVSPAQTTTYVVHDEFDCLADTVTVNVSAALPVRLVAFSGLFTDGVVRLQWQTDGESNAGHFVIQRSLDGRYFQSVGQVAAAGDTTGLRPYQFRDHDLPLNNPGNAYYRLEEVDRDGKRQYSRIISIDVSGLGDQWINVKPNPSSGTDALVEIAPGSGKCRLVLADASGRLLHERTLMLGAVPQAVSLGKLKTGTYVVSAFVNGRKISRKIVVQ